MATDHTNRLRVAYDEAVDNMGKECLKEPGVDGLVAMFLKSGLTISEQKMQDACEAADVNPEEDLHFGNFIETLRSYNFQFGDDTTAAAAVEVLGIDKQLTKHLSTIEQEEDDLIGCDHARFVSFMDSEI